MKFKTHAIIIAAALFVLDQILKYVAVARGPTATWYTYTLNTGVTFGFFPEANLAMIIVSLIATGLLVYVLKSASEHDFIGLTVVLAGVVSNLVDRVIMGGVIDYIRIGNFPVFNLADALIICGVAILLGLEIQNSSRSSRSSR